ncbi:LacI family transcriptional regulator [Companilactobacillus suantsaicola]|uniref:LacI family transcriptional regulator n=2 Tax=Companilactobacillus suantsaicola TaxID=2487723 RepID=A0A4Z0JMR5_9LACO|nr:LacI family transcriptional regulator [Companilactobacillus suantsaicola]
MILSSYKRIHRRYLMKKATIKDVSDLSGYSISTVSRVLNGNYPVKKQTKETILEAINKLHFTRNSVARNLRTNKTNIIGLVVADINNPYYSKIAKALDDGLFKRNYSLLVCNTDESEQKECKILETLIDKGVDFIIISPVSKNAELLRTIKNNGINVIIIDRNIGVSDFPFVGSDDFKEAKKLTEYLITRGHSKIAFITGTQKATTSQERLFGFRAALVENHLTFSNESLIEGLYKEEMAYENITKFLKRNQHNIQPYTAIFSSNNLMTLGLIKAAKELSISIPNDLSIVSFGQIELQDIIQPNVTCIKQNIDSMVELIFKNIDQLADDPTATISNDFIANSFLLGNSVKKIK